MGNEPFAGLKSEAHHFGAAIVRGYSGFGFSLLSITALSLVLPPVRVVPSIFLLEIAASIRLLPEVWGQVHWRSGASHPRAK